MFAIVILAMGFVVLRDFGWVLVLFAITVAPVLIVCWVWLYLFRSRAAQREAFLDVLGVAAEHGLPLAPGARAFGGLCGRGYRREMQALAYLLESGVETPRAIISVPGLLPRGAASLVAVGAQQGALASGVVEAQAAFANARRYRGNIIDKLMYLFALVASMNSIVGFILYFILPKFEAIFADFGVDLPGITVFIIKASHFIVGTLGWGVLAAFAILVVYGLARLLGFRLSRLPLLSWFSRRLDTASLLRSLAITVDQGRSIPEGLAAFESSYAVKRIGRQAERARVRIEQGEGWLDALRARGLISRGDASVLEPAQRAGNLAWALRAVAGSLERRHWYRLAVFAQLLLPMIVVAIGSLIGFLVIGFFLPLLQLIQRLGS
jgi:protein transport protein HofC